MTGPFGMFSMPMHVDFKRFEDFCAANLPAFHVENYDTWKTKYISIGEDNE